MYSPPPKLGVAFATAMLFMDTLLKKSAKYAKVS